MARELVSRQRLAVYGVAREEDRILLVREPRHDRWWLPGGGLAFGESPHQGLAREFDEEVGRTLTGARLIDVVSDVASLTQEYVELHSVRMIFEVQLLPGAGRREQDGATTDPTWHRECDLPDLRLAPWLHDWLNQHIHP